MALVAYSTRCWTNVLVNIQGPNVKTGVTAFCKELHQHFFFLIFYLKMEFSSRIKCVTWIWPWLPGHGLLSVFIHGQIYQPGIMWVSFDSVHLNLTAVRLKITNTLFWETWISCLFYQIHQSAQSISDENKMICNSMFWKELPRTPDFQVNPCHSECKRVGSWYLRLWKVW